MDDKELQEQLARGPLIRNGFDDTLRRKIHDRIENPRRRTTRFWHLPIGKASIAFSIVLVVILGVWSLNKADLRNTSNEDQASSQATKLTDQSSTPAGEADMLNSAMLIGLRNDITEASEREAPTSTYRTLLVVPQDNVLTIAAEGPGIYMPFNQEFWRISTVSDGSEQGAQTLVAAPADEAQVPTAIERNKTPLRASEKLLFAGNRYVSILQTTTVDEKGNSNSETSFLVNEVEHLDWEARQKSPAMLVKQRYTLAEVLDLEASGSDIEEWTIARMKGKWTAMQPSAAASLSNTASVTHLQPVSIPLTSKATGPDTLALDWDEVTSIEPAAEDAFTSSTEDILAVVLDNRIDLYPYKLPKEQMKPLRIKILPNESIVMVQWAQDGYIEAWKSWLSDWIPPTSSPRL